MSLVTSRLSTDVEATRALGVKFDFIQSGSGLALVYNTEERVAELSDALTEVIKTGKRNSEKDSCFLQGSCSEDLCGTKSGSSLHTSSVEKSVCPMKP